ncbi:uncharacterized protein LOC108700058 isoform X3 [Xenopus laevis]|uniref:Uncharacterized protein LOC108700058 isoform X3 n=1 Tax=Xenopus laevis TaxID=8355 RepID=A0A8J1LP06_XENLA|nr:uncharacterized protein LOC108700058 isoform X3 [Xenopus laevis]XP_041430894.1 uncharacterized protein LOC108700058 isoform X3 [Xenopus laevis]XP_041430895.1 uncharacterized protein LOC108700058 isoform X3 [Xenopus laevis]XP_041430896.1 uncharacterized protein LOC108700058 isoform X3 [Xenopus laevis]XP_041430897.1 uncharacterized protein LOC108700058 isoform X3 [Xenopus laevis]
MGKIANFPPSPMLLMGKFNALVNPLIDRLTPGPHTTPKFSRWVQAMNLTDVWRWKNPDKREYSCFSATYNTLSRIDLALATADLLPLVATVEYLPRAISDHSPLLVQLNFTPGPGERLWRLSPLWLSQPTVAKANEVAITEYWELNNGTASSGIVWEACKATMRGALTTAIRGARVEAVRELEERQRVSAEAERNYIEKVGPDTLGALRAAQTAVEEARIKTTQKRLLYATQKTFDKGEKNGKILAYLTRSQTPTNTIPKIVSPSGVTVTNPSQIANSFAEYYQDLNASQVDYTADQLMAYLDAIPFPQLTPHSVTSLNAPITLVEVQDAIASLHPNKTPGPDGLPSDWYKISRELLSPWLHKTLTDATEENQLPPSFNEALIVVIPKEGKDPLNCGSYRPISLLNTDAKVFAKVLATRLKQVIEEIIEPDQTGFMPSRSTNLNIRRLFTNIHAKHINQGSRIIVSLDAA